jgi:hypothetical protein
LIEKTLSKSQRDGILEFGDEESYRFYKGELADSSGTYIIFLVKLYIKVS